MIQRAAIVVAVFILCFGAGVICPEQSLALYCGSVQSLNSDVACSTEVLFQPDKQLILCQVLTSGGDVPRGGYTASISCQLRSDQGTWECRRETPKGVFQATLTETEWKNESVRCTKLCGECPSGWK